MVGNIAGNTATVTFGAAPGTGVNGYTVTYTAISPVAGSPQTVTTMASPVNLTGLTLGTTYSVSVTSNCTAGGNSAPASTTFATTGVSNDDCTVAVTLTPAVTCNPTSGTTVGSTQSIAPITCGSKTVLSGTRGDVWYKFVAFGTAATVVATGGAGFDPVLDIRTACPVPTGGSSFACMDATGSGGTETLPLTNLIPGNTYWIRVYNYLTATGTFTICLTGVPCVAPTALTATNVTATNATLTFTPPAANATGYTVTYTPTNPAGAAQTQTGTGSPITLTGLSPSTTYSVSLVSNCGGGNSSAPVTTTFTTFVACPAPTSLSATNITATSATLVFTPAAGVSSYTVTYTQNPGGTPMTQTGTGSPITITGLIPGKGYTATVVTNCSTAGTAATSAPVTVNFITPNVCLPVSALTATVITANSVTLTFTASPTGTNYSILYSTPGGTTQIATVANSPATLTGLLAGKTYTINVISTCGTSQTSTPATITFTTAAAAPTNASANPVQPTTAGINFTLPSGAVAYTVTYTGGGTTGTTTSTGSPMTLTGLLPGTTYTITIVATYPGGGQSAPITLTFTTPLVTSTRSALAGGQVRVFPNPAHTAFTVELPALGATRTATLELLNTLGQRVGQQTVSLTPGGTHAPVDASALPAGIYLLRVQAGGETAVTRVVIE